MIYSNNNYFFFDYQRKKLLRISEKGENFQELISFSGSFETKMKPNKSNSEEIFLSNCSESLTSFDTKKNIFSNIENSPGERVFDFESLSQSRLLLLTEQGHLILKKKNFLNSHWEEVSKAKINLGDAQGTCCDKIAICPEEKMVAVCINTYTKLSKIVFFKIFKNQLVFKSVVDFPNLDFNYFEDLKFHKSENFKRNYVLTGLSNFTNTTICTLVIDKKNLKLLTLRKKNLELHHPCDLHQVEGDLVGIDGFGRLFCIGN